MNPRLIVLVMAAILLGVSYGLLKSVNHARAERHPVAGGSVASDAPSPSGPAKVTAGDEAGSTGSSPAGADGPGEDETPSGSTAGGEGPVEPEVSYPDLGFNDPFFRESESSLRMIVDLSEKKMSEPVARVNGEPIFYRDLISECILRYGMDSVVGTVIREYIVVSELGRRAMPIVPDSARIDNEIQKFLREKYRGKTLEQVLSEINFTESYFRFQVMLQRAMEDIYKMDEEDGELPNPFETGSGGPTKARLEKWNKRMERQKEIDAAVAQGSGLRDYNQKRREALKDKAGPSHPLFMQIWMQDLETRHHIEREAKDLPEEVFARVDGVPIDLKTVAPRLLLGLTERQRYDALDRLIERRILEQAFAKEGVTPNMKRVNRLYREEKAEFKGSLITWEMYLQWENTNPTLYKNDMATFDCIDQIQGLDISEETLKKHYEANPDVFGHGGRRVSHILLSALDPKTGLPRDERAYIEARQRAGAVAEEIAEGKEFFDLVMRYSEDLETKKYTTIPNTKTRIAGDLGIVQARDTKIDPAIVEAVFALGEGATAGPILTKKGYHFVHVTQSRAPKETAYDEMAVNVQRDFFQQRRKGFIEEQREAAEVKILFGDGKDPWAPYHAAPRD